MAMVEMQTTAALAECKPLRHWLNPAAKCRRVAASKTVLR